MMTKNNLSNYPNDDKIIIPMVTKHNLLDVFRININAFKHLVYSY